MRDIKFRAWDKEEKRMTYLGRDGEDILYFDSCGDDNVYWTRNHDGDDWVIDSFELMQYTGLKDKNGKEIYEGDIVTSTKGEFQINGVVSYQAPGFCVTVDENNTWIEILDENIEVLGNVYENKELL